MTSRNGTTARQRLLVRGTLVVLAVLAVVVGLVCVAVFPPTANSWYPKCMSYTLAGIHCPGCGMTRAAHFALNGRLLEALSQNALVIVVVPYLLVVFLRGLWHYLWQTPSPKLGFRSPKWVTFLLIGVLLAFTIARNIPVEPFTSLAPKELTSTSAQTDPSAPPPATE